MPKKKTLKQILREEYGSEVFDHLKKQWKKVARKWLQQKPVEHIAVVQFRADLLEELE